MAVDLLRGDVVVDVMTVSKIALVAFAVGMITPSVLAENSAPAGSPNGPVVGSPAIPAAGPPSGGCLVTPAAQSDSEVQVFLADPTALLKSFPTGGPDMTVKVRSLAGTEARTVPALIDAAKIGTDAHKAAIANGLGGAALACVKTRADVSQFIQQQVAGFDNKTFVDAFLLSTSNVATAATSPGGPTTAGVGGAIGAALGGNGSGASTNAADLTTANTNETFSFTRGNFSSGGSGAVSSSANLPVSP